MTYPNIFDWYRISTDYDSEDDDYEDDGDYEIEWVEDEGPWFTMYGEEEN